MTPEERAKALCSDLIAFGQGPIALPDAVVARVAAAIREAEEEARKRGAEEEREACAKIADRHWRRARAGRDPRPLCHIS